MAVSLTTDITHQPNESSFAIYIVQATSPLEDEEASTPMSMMLPTAHSDDSRIHSSSSSRSINHADGGDEAAAAAGGRVDETTQSVHHHQRHHAPLWAQLTYFIALGAFFLYLMIDR